MYGKIDAEFGFRIGVGLDCRSLVVRLLFKMAVRYLSCETLVYGKRIGVPRRVNGEIVQYEIDGDDVRFFCCDDGDLFGVVVGRWNVPDEVRYVEFDRMELGNHVGVGVPRFYDNKGNLLKIGNR